MRHVKNAVVIIIQVTFHLLKCKIHSGIYIFATLGCFSDIRCIAVSSFCTLPHPLRKGHFLSSVPTLEKLKNKKLPPSVLFFGVLSQVTRKGKLVMCSDSNTWIMGSTWGPGTTEEACLLKYNVIYIMHLCSRQPLEQVICTNCFSVMGCATPWYRFNIVETSYTVSEHTTGASNKTSPRATVDHSIKAHVIIS